MPQDRYSDYNVAPDYWVRQYGVGSEIDEQEWRLYMQRRDQLVDSILQRVQLGSQIATSMQDQLNQIATQATLGGILGALNTPTQPLPTTQRTAQVLADSIINERAQQGAYNQREPQRMTHELLGAADFYGIENPNRYTPDQLVQLIQSRRDQIATPDRSETGIRTLLGYRPTEREQALIETAQLGIGALFIGATDAIIETSQRVPFIGDALAKTKTIQDADRWLAMVEEGFRGDQVGAEVTGWNIAKGLGGVIGYIIPAEAAWQIAGAFGSLGAIATVGSRMSPISRAAIRGGSAAWMLEGGGEDPIQERLMRIGIGAGFAGVATWGVPKILDRLRRSFPSRFGGGMPLDNELASDYDPGWEDAVLVDELFLPPTAGRAASSIDEIFVSGAPSRAPGTSMVHRPGGVPNSETALLDEELASFARPPAATRAPAADPETTALVNGTMEVRSAELRQAGFDPRSGLPDRPSLERSLPSIETDPGVAVVLYNSSEPAVVRALQVAASEVPGVGLFHSRAGEIVASVPKQALVQFRGRSAELMEGDITSAVSGNDLAAAEAGLLAERTRLPRSVDGDALSSYLAEYGSDPTSITRDTALEIDAPDFWPMPGPESAGFGLPDLGVIEQRLRLRPDDPGARALYAQQLDRGLGLADAVGVSNPQTELAGRVVQELSTPRYDGVIEQQDYGLSVAATHRFTMPNGQNVDASVSYSADTGELHVNWIGGPQLGGTAGVAAGDLGPSALRPIISQLRQLYPQAQSFSGLRVSGARMQAHRADSRTSLNARVNTSRLDRWLSRTEALAEGSTLTKHATVIESPALAELSTHSVYDDADVVNAALQTNPGQISIVRNVSDLSKAVRDLVREVAPGATAPREFRVVQRQDGTHLLVSDGLPLTNSRVRQYKDWGIFEGQQARTAAGQDVVIIAPGEMTTVRPLYGDEPYLVRHSELLAGRSTAEFVEPAALAGIDAPTIYNEFRAFTTRYMAGESSTAGLPQFGWLELETSSQIPMLIDRFFRERGIVQPALRRTLTAYLDQRRVADYRQLASEEFVEAQRIVRDVSNEVTAAQLDDELVTSVHELAETKGFQLVPYVSSPGYTLRDMLGELEVPVTDEEAARDFLTSFEREMPDITPISDFPVEAMPMVVGGPPQTMLEPYWRRGAETFTAAQEHVLRWLTRELERMENLPAAVGGGGLTPPPPPPPGSAPPLGGGPPELPPGYYAMPGQVQPTTLAQQFRQGGRRLAEVMEDADSIFVNWFFPMRSWALHWENRLTDIGIDQARMWSQYNAVVTGRSQAHNAAVPLYERWHGISGQLRRRIKRHGHVARIAELPTWNDQLREMQRLGYSPREIQAQRQFTVFMDELFGMSGIDDTRRIWNYVSHVRSRQALHVDDPFYDAEGSLTPEVRWFAEMAREGNMQFREMDVDMLVPLYIRGMTFRQFVAPAWEEMAAAWQANVPTGVPTDIPTYLRTQVKGWLHLVRFGFTGESEVAVQGIRRTLNKVGIPVTNQDVQGFWNTIQANMYRAGIGLRPHIWFRDSINPLLTGTKIGIRPVAEVYLNFMRSGRFREEAAQRALRGGWLERGAVQIPGGDLFGDQVVNEFGGAPPGFAPSRVLQAVGYGPEQMLAVREGMARVGDLVHDLTPRRLRGGVQGTLADPLFWYTRLGEFNRVVSGEAGYQTARRAIESYRAAGSPGGDGLAQLMAESKAVVWRPPVRRQFQELIAANQDEAAAFLLANEAANMQNRYGTVEHSPKIQRSGVVGRQAMMYGTFSAQHLQQLTDGVARAEVPLVERAGFAARYAAITAALAGASIYTGWNFYKWMWPGSLTFMGGPMVEPTLRSYQIATGAVNEMTGQYVTPEQRAAQASAQNPNNPGILGTLFPYMGGVATAEGLSTMLRSEIPVEGSLRYLLTGQQTAGPNVQNWMETLGFSSAQPQAGGWGPTIEAAASLPPVRATEPTGLTEGQMRAAGVSNPANVRRSERGYYVYDTDRRTRDGKRPTHRLDLPSGRHDGETWEQYEDRVNGTPRSAFPAEARRINRDIGALHPDMHQRLAAFLVEARRQGQRIWVAETYRPQVRQEFLFREGRAADAEPYPVTWTLTSNHADRRAADLRAPNRRGYLWIQENAPKFGLGVLGMDDPGHVELPQSKAMPNPAQQHAQQQASAGAGMMQ